ncbi:4-hydroxy-tetrahydrodipicolinate synthase [Maribacter vaceletii]|uniref:4-hydroxy-tetrahydrodipicolinate synthase n=1 Tax=Maribacter vaceletii TaxID=1206816 RepID=A0A495E9L9_9FLAO|nr:4-hydroxy-tetrahydrodipicolinate synthase [Maribacter vaceletii]RKR13391.1 4-hydroxy-tetrahydrodipicolinate synthase [Maribacter vaceletii]
MKELLGTGVALVTPFNEDGNVDVAALTVIVEYNINNGVDYLVVLGTTGESVTLSKAEKQLVIDTITATNAGRLPMVLGVGGNNTALIVEELSSVNLKDFVAILSVSPYYNKPTQEGIYQHFKAISLASPIPVILYNVPGRTGSNVLPETVVRLAQDFENIVAVKEACGDIVQVMELIKNTPDGFHVISGDDITALPSVLAGGSGVISVIGQGLPNEFSSMIRLGLEKKVEEAYRLHYNMQEGMQLIFEEGNPAGIKTILELAGLCKATVRLPLVEATSELKQKIEAFVKPFIKVTA